MGDTTARPNPPSVASGAIAVPNARTGSVVLVVERTQSALPSVNTRQSREASGEVLRLPLRKKQVQWSETTHNNEHEGKKTSKICCIFHKKRAFDESSSESSCDETSEDDTDRHKCKNRHHDCGPSQSGPGDCPAEGEHVSQPGSGQS
mmetsp:Transcript_889/g.1455  ORF Transcript_889/g.1455 Transcript_889/m.1455 type:complete len:148 (-) Transcript_889:398-841(-)